MKTLADIINSYNPKKYLEVGKNNNTNNFRNIKATSKDFVHDIKDFKDEVDLCLIDCKTDYEFAFKQLEKALWIADLIAIHNVLPKNKEYTRPDLCGEMWKLGLYCAKNYAFELYEQDHGVLVIDSEAKIHEINKDISFGLFTTHEDLLASYDMLNQTVFDEIDDKDYNSLSNDQLKELYREQFGQYPRGRFNRDKIIEKLS